ncbi:hypothetical protein FIU85_15575 [Roseovarius sp. THAF8]|nr:hypothetical protein [Roseovarius sp. THAF8]QFT98733.1 hypothetical protein FIU85_15575 [Roseovarius sp. THAF8]
MGFWKTVLAVFVGILLYNVVDNLVIEFFTANPDLQNAIRGGS